MARWRQLEFAPTRLGVVSRSYQRSLDTPLLGAGSAGCAGTGLGMHVYTCVSTVWAFSFV